jgi:uncharacterized protein YdiU (UPF0061 family)
MTIFKNTYASLPTRFSQKIYPENFQNSSLIALNEKLFKDLSLDSLELSEDEIAHVFSGQKILSGSEPLAQAYAGHQFGHFVPQLGDGRAHLLGEVNGFDIQLKGSGRTQFSRRGDGRSALGPVIREYLVSEGMYALGVPTTRALCAVATREEVLRQDGPEPGGIFTRVASSHLRVGTFAFFAAREDHEAVETLLDYSLERHYPEGVKLDSLEEKSFYLLEKVIDKQAELIAHWSALGFIHGVMNTDNFSIAGITIDYGPCAFMDEFSFNKVFSSIDQHGRYAFFNQTEIGKWNTIRLAECLLPLIDKDQEKAVKKVQERILPLLVQFDEKRMQFLAKKFGIQDFQKSDESLVMTFLRYLEKHSLDFTRSFRMLPRLHTGDFEGFAQDEDLGAFYKLWKERVSNIGNLDKVNPYFIPRNHHVQKAIDDSYQGNYKTFHRLNKAYQNPFEENEEFEDLALPPLKSERIYQTFCGT